MKRRIAAILGALLLLVTTASAPATSESDDASAKLSALFSNAGGMQWVNSDISGTVKASDSFRAQDDFNAFVNKDWFVSNESYSGTFQQTLDRVYEKKVAVLEELPERKGKAAEELLKYYELASDWEERNKVGIEPLKPYLQAIDNITTREELYDWICDPEMNPYGIAPVMYSGNYRSEKDPSLYVCGLDQPDLFLESSGLYYDLSQVPNLEKKELKETEFTLIAKKLGYADLQIKSLFADNYRFEKKMLSAHSLVTKEHVDDCTYTRKEAIEAAGNYPLEKYLNSLGITEEVPVKTDLKYLKKLDKLCKKGNIDKIKAMLKIQFLKYNYYNLDRELYDSVKDVNVELGTANATPYDYDEERIENSIFLDEYLGRSILIGAFDEIYLEKNVHPEDKEVLEKLVQDVIDSYREVLMNEDWLSDEGKKAAVEKLDQIIPHILYPNYELLNYDELNVVSKSEGGSFAEAQLELVRFKHKIDVKSLYQKYDRNIWNPYSPDFSTTVPNAFYSAEDNCIYILAGIFETPFYFEGISEEELLGALGCVIGHELTHGFDDAGIKYNAEGIKTEWLPSVDKQVYSERVTKLQSYYTVMKPVDNLPYNGTQVSGEAPADMGGMKITLNIAKNIDNFDYERYFSSYASLWRTEWDYKTEKTRFERDPHPLAYLRVNVTVQQFDEFYEIYDVKPGDKMYLDPKKRIAVW